MEPETTATTGTRPGTSPKARGAETFDLERDFENVVRRFQKPILNYIYRMIRNEETAMDLTQDVFVKAYNARASFDGRSQLSTWLFTIAANHTRDYLKLKRHDGETAIDESGDA